MPVLRDPPEQIAPQPCRPYAHRRTQHHLPPIHTRASPSHQRPQDTRPRGFCMPGSGCGSAGAEGGQVEGQSSAGEVGERAGEVVETLGLGRDGGEGGEALEGVSEGDGGEEGAEEGGAEGGGVEEGGEEGHGGSEGVEVG